MATRPLELVPSGCGRNLAARLTWTQDEDALIVASVRELGCKWRLIAQRLHDRSDDSVRNRWKRVRHLPIHNNGRDLKPLFNETKPAAPTGAGVVGGGGGNDAGTGERVSWSVSEDETIMRSVDEIGNKWQKIALRLPGRTEHAIRNRFARLQSLANRGQPIVLTSGRGLPIGIQLMQ